MKEKTTPAESASRVCYETMEVHARGCIQRWLQDLLEDEVAEFLGRAKSQRRAEFEEPRVGPHGHDHRAPSQDQELGAALRALSAAAVQVAQ